MTGKEILSGDNSSGQSDFETSSVNKQTAIDDVGEPENAGSSENEKLEQVNSFFLLNSQS